jgi:putative addiction module component (TIGR02574 family)
MTTAELLAYLQSEALKLPMQERRELVRSLEGTLDDVDDDSFDLHPSWRAELEQRVSDIDNGVAKGMTPAEMMAQVRARFGW